MAAVTNELVTKFTFKGSLKPLSDFQKGLRGNILSLGKYGAAIGAVVAATATWANVTLRGAESLVRLSEDTGIAIDKLQQMQYVAAQSGLSAADFESSVSSLTDKIGEAATQGSEDFNRLGISVRDASGNIKTTDTIIRELSGRLKGLSKAQEINFASKLGIDIKLIKSFQKSNAELKQLTETASKFGVITKAQTRELNKYYASIESLKFGFSAVSRQMALQFAPIMEKVSKAVTDFLAEFGGTAGKIFAEFIDGIGNIIGAVDSFISNTVGWKPILAAFGAAMLVAFPIVAIVGAVGTILIAVEDLITAFKGGKSVIADFFQDTFDLDIVNTMTEAFRGLSNIMRDLSSQFSSFKSLFSSDSDTGFFDKLQDTTLFKMATLQPLPASAEAGSATPQQTITNDIKIDVKSNDPEAAGMVVSNALSRELEQASFQYGKGGR